MCYSGYCWFEDEMGNCTIIARSFKEFEEKYGYDPCLVGGLPYCPEAEEFINTHQEELEAALKKYWNDVKNTRNCWKILDK